MDLPEDVLLLHAEWIALQAKARAAREAEFGGWRIEDMAERIAYCDQARNRSALASEAARDAGRALAKALPEQALYPRDAPYIASVAQAAAAKRRQASRAGWPIRYRAAKVWAKDHACWYICLEEIAVSPDGEIVPMSAQMFDDAICEADRRNQILAGRGALARAA